MTSTLSRWTAIRRFGGALFIAPSFVMLAFIMLIPIAVSFSISFTDYSVLDPGKWRGGDNYLKLLASEPFMDALIHTVIYTLIAVPLQTVLSLLIANVIAQRFRNRRGQFIRSALFIPVITSSALIGIVWRFLLDTDTGTINGFLGTLGIPGPNWFGESDLALITVALVTVWKNIGYFLVIYYAGILNVPQELYEASAIDGASPARQFFHITIPMVKPATVLVVVLGTIWSFQVFDLVYTMTGGGPGGATTTLVMAIYKEGFRNFNMGYASAMGMVLFVIILAVSLVQWRLLRNGR